MDELDQRIKEAAARNGYLQAVNEVQELLLTALREECSLKEFGAMFATFTLSLAARATAQTDQDDAFLEARRHG